MSATNSDSRATDEQGAIAEASGASVAPEDSVEAVEAMLAAHEMADNPCANALDQLWREIILARNPNYGDWEYPMQAFRHLKCEFDDVAKQRDEARFERDQLQKTIDFLALEEQATRANQLKIREVVERERDQAQAHCRELAKLVMEMRCFVKSYGLDDIGQDSEWVQWKRCAIAVDMLLAAHPEWLR